MATSRQAGSAAIEFSVILPILLAMTYSLFAYSYTFVVQQSLTFAAQQAAESAVAVVVPDSGTVSTTYWPAIEARAKTTAAASLGWLPEAQRQAVIDSIKAVPCGCDALPLNSNGVKVTINFPLLKQMFPEIPLPIIGSIPNLPENLKVSSVVLLSS